MTDDMTLLRDYARHNSEQAFAALVARHISLVYSVALRQVNDPHLAEEITQVTFILLARKAASLGSKTILPGWLCRTTRYTSANALTMQRRRQHREQEGHMQSMLKESEPNPWPEIAPLLEAALAQLGERDHDALVLRFFKDKSFQEIGAAFGTNENSAKKRVYHGLEKLRRYFSRHGVASTADIIAKAISANSVQAAPAALAKSVTTLAVAKGATASGSTLSLIKGALKLMAWTKAKTVIVAGVAVLLAAGTTPAIIKVIQGRTDSRSSSCPRATPATQSIKGQLFGLAQLVDAGNTTPEAAWESRYWARAQGDYDAVIAATDPQVLNGAKDWMGDKATFRARSQKEFASLQGFQILARKNLASDRVELKYQFAFQKSSTPQETKIVEMIEVNGAWRCRQTRAYDASWEDGSEPEPQP